MLTNVYEYDEINRTAYLAIERTFYSADQILAMKSEFVSFDLLWIAIKSYSNN